jgi:hypothetical protein
VTMLRKPTGTNDWLLQYLSCNTSDEKRGETLDFELLKNLSRFKKRRLQISSQIFRLNVVSFNADVTADFVSFLSTFLRNANKRFF